MNFQVASLWIGSPLSCLERACIQSFLEQGYVYNLYVMDMSMAVPKGVVLRDARDIYLDADVEMNQISRKHAAIYSDVFRMHLMQMTDYVWVDLDMYCVRPLDVKSEYLFGVVRSRGAINNCVLRLPKNSLALKLVIDFLQSEVPLPFWLGDETIRRLVDRYERTGRLTLYDLPWTTTGPSVTRWALDVTGELRRGQHWHKYWPVRGFLDPARSIDEYEPDWVMFHHFLGETRRDIKNEFAGIPPVGSYIDFICKRHEIDPEKYPVV